MSNYNTEETANSLKTDNWGSKELAAGGVSVVEAALVSVIN